MCSLIADIKCIDINDCFLHLSPSIYNKLCSSVPQFVKGHVVKSQEVVYFSTSTVICHQLSDECVGLSPLYASTLKLSSEDKIVLSPIAALSSLSKVTAYPVSDDDRQILEIAFGNIEASLLNQLRVVWPNQCFPVWISPSITAKLVVDKIYPDIEFGTLEEDTELIIGDVKDVNSLMKKSSTQLLSSSSTCNESVTCSKKELPNDYSCNLIEPLSYNIVCRLIPEQNNTPPYHVTLSPLDCPDWLKKCDPGSVFQLTGCSDPYPKVYVSASVEATSFKDIGFCKALMSSTSVFHHLSLQYGSKVILSQKNSTSDELSSILITPCPQLKKKMPLNEIETVFRQKISFFCLKYGRCLMNSKGVFPLNDATSVTVTLRPLNLEWAFLTLISLYNIPISVNTLETNSPSLNGDSSKIIEDSQSSCVLNTANSEVSLLLEHSLNLKKGITRGPSFMNSFLLVGKQGTGKTHMVNNILLAISKFPYWIYFEKIDCLSLKGKRIENVGKIISSHLNSCKQKQPSVFLIENIDIICSTFSPELEKSEASFHTQRVSKKVADILELFMLNSSVAILATCESISSVNGALFKRRGRSIFSTIIPIQPLTQEERRLLMESTILNRTSTSELSVKDLNLEYYSSLTDSYVAGDLIRFIEKAIFEATQRCNSILNELFLTKNDLEKAFESSSAFMHNKLKVQKHHDIRLSDVGGLKSVKEKLVEVIVWPSKYSCLLDQCPLKKQTGVLIYGAPGSGKTLIARAIARESNLNFITVKGPELMSKYIGESEEGIRRVFENAQAAKPSLLFFDEFESLAPRRGEEQTGVTDRVVNQLLTALDGVEPLCGVIVVAASSRPDLIDPALLRSGRLSHHLFCSFPDMEDRNEILEKLTSSLVLDNGVDLKQIAEQTKDFSGADLKGLLTTAQIQVLDKFDESALENESEIVSENVKRDVMITQDDLLAALEQTRPSLSKRDRLHFSTIYNMFSKGNVLDVTKQKAIFA